MLATLSSIVLLVEKMVIHRFWRYILPFFSLNNREGDALKYIPQNHVDTSLFNIYKLSPVGYLLNRYIIIASEQRKKKYLVLRRSSIPHYFIISQLVSLRKVSIFAASFEMGNRKSKHNLTDPGFMQFGTAEIKNWIHW